MGQTVTTKVLADTRQAEKGFKGLSSSVLKAGAAVAALGVAFVKVIDTITLAGDSLDKLSTRTGASVEFISSLNLNLQQSDTSARAFGNGMKRLARNISDAEDGLTTATRGFERIGVEFKDNVGNLRELEDILPDIIRGINSLSTETEKAAVSQEIFGRGGSELLVFLKQGNLEIEKQIERSRELGLVWSTEDAKAAAEFRDRMVELREIGLSLLRDVFIPILNPLSQMAKRMGDVVASLRGFNEEAEKIQLIQEERGLFQALFGQAPTAVPSLPVTPLPAGIPPTPEAPIISFIETFLEEIDTLSEKLRPPRVDPISFTETFLGDLTDPLNLEKSFGLTSEQIQELNVSLGDLGDMLEELRTSKLVQFQIAFGEGFSSLFEGILTGTATFGENFNRLWKNILEGIISNLTETAGQRIGGFLFSAGAAFLTGGASAAIGAGVGVSTEFAGSRAPGGGMTRAGTTINIQAIDAKGVAAFFDDRGNAESVLSGLEKIIDRG